MCVCCALYYFIRLLYINLFTCCVWSNANSCSPCENRISLHFFRTHIVNLINFFLIYWIFLPYSQNLVIISSQCTAFLYAQHNCSKPSLQFFSFFLFVVRLNFLFLNIEVDFDQFAIKRLKRVKFCNLAQE